MNKIDEAKKILERYNQTHVKVENETLAEQILNIDFEQIENLYRTITNEKRTCCNSIIEPVEAFNPEKASKKEINKYIEIGKNKVKTGKFAVTIMAGGQGTRLGHKGPKGTFPIKLNSENKYLFQLIIEKLEQAEKDYEITLPCYIMTSPENNDETIAFFEKNNYFGYNKEYIKFFRQGEQPLIDKEGKIVLNEKGLIQLASDGNGGIFYSMAKNGIIDDMKKRGIEWVFIGSVDNLLIKYVDTLLLGLAIENGSKVATRTIIKNSPYENVGILCKKNGKVKVIEYTEIPEEIRLAVNSDGEIKYGESHIMCNLFNIEAIEKASSNELKYHITEKKIKIKDNGNLIDTECYKFEKFVFDTFCLFDNITVLRGKREEDFAPIKNLKGIDSPETAKNMYEQYMSKLV